MGHGDVVELEGEDYGLVLSLPPLPGITLAPDNEVYLIHGAKGAPVRHPKGGGSIAGGYRLRGSDYTLSEMYQIYSETFKDSYGVRPKPWDIPKDLDSLLEALEELPYGHPY